jgi:hypothetical protein
MVKFGVFLYWMVGLVPGVAVAADMPLEWRMECSGHLQFSLPVSAVAAGMSYDFLTAHLIHPSNSMTFSFPDGQQAGWSKADFESPILISNELSSPQFADLRKTFLQSKVLTKKFIKEKLSSDQQQPIGDVSGMPGHSAAWSIGTSVRMFVPLERHLLMMNVDERDKGIGVSIDLAKKLAAGTSYRPIFTVPQGRGICLPNVYIRNNSDEIRDIATTYKLVAQPDVSIWIKDAGAAKYEEKARERNAQPDNVVDNFWAQYEISPTVKKVSPLRSKNSVQLAGRRGLSSFVTITRRDGSVDFGYFGAARGDVTKSDAPDINVYVITQSSDARSKNVAPLDEKDFRELVKTVTESIQLRTFN